MSGRRRGLCASLRPHLVSSAGDALPATHIDTRRPSPLMAHRALRMLLILMAGFSSARHQRHRAHQADCRGHQAADTHNLVVCTPCALATHSPSSDSRPAGTRTSSTGRVACARRALASPSLAPHCQRRRRCACTTARQHDSTADGRYVVLPEDVPAARRGGARRSLRRSSRETRSSGSPHAHFC